MIYIRLDDQKEICIREWKTREKTDIIAEDWMEYQESCGIKELKRLARQTSWTRKYPDKGKNSEHIWMNEVLWLQVQEEIEKMIRIIPTRCVVGDEVEDGSYLNPGKKGCMK